MDEQNRKQQQLQKVIQEHPEINDRLKEIHADSQTEIQEKIIALMKEYGVELTAEDFKAPSGELSDDELKAIAGGGGCGCWAGGGGGGDGLICTCIELGGGDIFDASTLALRKANEQGRNVGACICAVIGAGATNWGDIDPYE